MFSFIIAFVSFVITILLHITTLSYKTTKVVSKTVDKVDKTHKKAQAKRGSTSELRQKINNVGNTTRKVTRMTLHTVLHFFRFLTIILSVLSFLVSMYMIIGVLALMGTVGYTVLAINGGHIGGDKSFDITNEADTEDENESTGSSLLAAPQGDREGNLEIVSQAYIKYVPKYGTRTYDIQVIPDFDIGYGKGKARADCTGFAAAYASLVSGEAVQTSGSSLMVKNWNAEKHGWKYHLCTELSSIDDLQMGDILVGNSGNKDRAGRVGSKGHHAEVYIDNEHTMGWGYVHKSYPANNKVTFKDGMCYDSGHCYQCFYRYEGK